MRPILAVLSLLGFASLAAAGNADPMARLLTPAEQLDGWIALFDGQSFFGWEHEAEGTIKDGLLLVGGRKSSKLQTTTEFGPSDVHFEYELVGAKQASVIIMGTRYELSPVPGRRGWQTVDARIKPEAVELAQSGPEATARANRMTRRRDGGNRRGRITFETPQGSLLILRKLRLRPRDLQPIFNGKDLSDWTVHPDRKSIYSVTAEGELRVQNGPGDIQTKGQWQDFVLQLQIRTGGKHLNSGVFFRCLPGQFWSGYEAQIRNQWQGNDRTKPIDFGTGAIYRRQPARRVVPNDMEWFTMTVAAHGRHLAVWVNGYATADFLDTRPPHTSARQGTKTDKGPISLQGHDPSTDLLFRGIRVAELPPPPG